MSAPMLSKTADRIVTALASGPMYEGALGLVLDWPKDFNSTIRALKDRGVIQRDLPDNPYTWKLAP